MSRAARTARGGAGALIATVFAAASHALAGGSVTPLAVAATAVVALPLCVALAGRAESLWRLTLAVTASQFVYHWSFAGLGVASSAQSPGPRSPHAAHLGSTVFSPELIASGAADAWMWAAHAAAAAITIALMHGGERAALGLLRLVRSALPAIHPAPLLPVHREPRTARGFFSAPDALRERLTVLSAISHRGPPAAISAAGR